jgi:dihydrofolate synthase/folylpolyglutamate synthase
MKPRFADLAGWLQWQEGLHPNVIDLGIVRIQQVAQRLFGDDFTQHQPFTITVAGTNGKGSCVTVISALLAATGKCVGSFTSPHLLAYNERIRIDGKPVADDELCDAFTAIDAARGDTSLTYFEFNALAALWVFYQHHVDVQVLEVGLGGRLDAVNILDADIAVITNIALDHTDWLGDTREVIGIEKAGILRRNGKLVYGEIDMPSSIQQRVKKLDCECRQLGTVFDGVICENEWQWHGLSSAGEILSLQSFLPTLPLPSVACALQVLAWMNCWQPALFSSLLPALTLAGRFEQLNINGQHWIFDVAHNVAGAQFLVNKLKRDIHEPVDILFAAMADKDLRGIVSSLKPAVVHWYLLALDDNPRAATHEQITRVLEQEGIANENYTCITEQDALHLVSEKNIARTRLVAGSFFTVAAIKSRLLNESSLLIESLV